MANSGTIKKGEVRNPHGRAGKPVGRTDASVRADGWLNVLNNLGSRRDAAQHTKYHPSARIDRKTLEGIFRSDGLGRKVITLKPDDALREWIEADQPLLDELKRIKAKQELTEAAYWSRLYGGSVLVALIDDGGEFEEEVNYSQIRRVAQLRVYERHRVTWTTADVDTDPMSPYFGEPLVYSVQPIQGTPYRVHRSRLWRFDGEALPTDERQRNDGWGDSTLQSVYDGLKNYGSTMNASASIVQDFIQVVLGVKGLSDMLAQGEDDLVSKRATIMDLTRSTANLAMIDADGETYDKKASSVTGLPELWDKFAMHVCTMSGYPATKLLGKAPDGMNATGEGDMRNYYDSVQAYRGDDIQPCIEWLVGLLDAQVEWSRNERPETMEFQWPPLWQPTEQEWATIKKTNAETDVLYQQMNSGVDPEYVYHMRFGMGEYRPDITFEYEAYLQWLEERMALEGNNQPEGDPEAAPEDRPTGQGEDVQKEALNGAQIQALQQIAQAVATGQMPTETAVEIIGVSFTQITEEQARRIIDPMDSFTPEVLGADQ